MRVIMNLQRARVLALILVGLSVAAPVARAADTKIGYVDLQRAIQDTTAGKKAKKTLETEFNEKKKEIEKREKDLKAMNDDLEKKKSVLSEEVRLKKQGELQQEMLKYREMVGSSQVAIQKKEGELLEPIVEKLRELIEKIAKEKDISMVLEKSERNPTIIWAKKDLDMTDEVVKAFEKSQTK